MSADDDDQADQQHQQSPYPYLPTHLGISMGIPVEIPTGFTYPRQPWINANNPLPFTPAESSVLYLELKIVLLLSQNQQFGDSSLPLPAQNPFRTPAYMPCCVIVLCRCYYGYMQNAHYFILVFGWVGGGMVGISPFSGSVSSFSCIVSIDFSVLM